MKFSPSEWGATVLAIHSIKVRPVIEQYLHDL